MPFFDVEQQGNVVCASRLQAAKCEVQGRKLVRIDHLRIRAV